MATNTPKMFGNQAPPPPGDEMKRIIMMSGVLVVLLAVFVYYLPGGEREAEHDVELPASAQQDDIDRPRVRVPELDVEALAALVDDSTEDKRATLEAEARELLLDHTAKLVDRHYDAMGAPILGEELITEITADPDAWRGKPLRLRGFILDHVQRARPNGEPFYQGSIVLDDSTVAHFVADDLGHEKLGPGMAVRLDGFFMKVLVEDVAGKWMDAPLVVGHEAQRSYPALYTELPNARVEDGSTFTESELANIVNDDIRDGVGSLPFAEKWKLMGRAALAADDDIDWASVPVLDKATMQSMLADPEPWRGMPIQLPLDGAALLTVTNRPAGENPARVERYADGWLAEYSWAGMASTVQFLAPFDVDIDTAEDPTVVARGFFFKNLVYQSDAAGLRMTPVLVLSDIRKIGRPGPGSVPTLMAIVAGGALLFGLILYLLVQRDRKRTAAFEARRRERRRAQRGDGAAPSAG